MPHLHFRVGVFGVGSAHGADVLGWHAVEYLEPRLVSPGRAEVECFLSRTPLDMVSRWAGLDQVVIIDALPVEHADQAPRQVDLDELAAQAGLSSHGLGIREAVELARAVGFTPAILVIALPVWCSGFTTAADYLARHGEPLLRLVQSRLAPGGSRASG